MAEMNGELATRIAEALFTAYGSGGSSERGDQLRIMSEGRYLAGWAFDPAVAQIAEVLRLATTEQETPHDR